MIDPWIPNSKTYSVTYPIKEMLRRANLKVKIWDRGAPLLPVDGGSFEALIGRLRQLMKWQEEGVSSVEVFYDPIYFTRNRHTPGLMDPLHGIFVLKYKGRK